MIEGMRKRNMKCVISRVTLCLHSRRCVQQRTGRRAEMETVTERERQNERERRGREKSVREDVVLRNRKREKEGNTQRD